jgi:hypothetical protein
MAEEALLTHRHLDEYRERLGQVGVPIDAIKGRALSDGEIDALVEPLPVGLSAEARVWWSWDGGGDWASDSTEHPIAPGMYWMSLDRAVAAYRENRALAEERGGTEGRDTWWRPAWIPLLSPDTGTTIACDCSVPTATPSPLFVVWWKLPDYDGPQDGTSSIRQMVEWWIEAIENNVWDYDRSAGAWRRDYQRVPPGREGVV